MTLAQRFASFFNNHSLKPAEIISALLLTRSEIREAPRPQAGRSAKLTALSQAGSRGVPVKIISFRSKFLDQLSNFFVSGIEMILQFFAYQWHSILEDVTFRHVLLISRR